MIEVRKAIAMHDKAMIRAKKVCEICGRNTQLMVRTNQYFDYRKYMITGKIEQRELSAVCPSCNNHMIARSSQNNVGFTGYCSITPSGSVVEYR